MSAQSGAVAEAKLDQSAEPLIETIAIIAGSAEIEIV
jgi:hypothetical protein